MLALAGRYLSVLLVFLMLVLLARRLPPDEYGVFVLAFGVTATGSYFSGFGAPDGAVRIIAEARATNDLMKVAGAADGLLKAAGATVALALMASGAALAMFGSNSFVPFLCIWIGNWSFLFAMAMGLLALGNEKAGSLFFYAAGSASMVFTVLPYVLLATSPSGIGAITLAAIGYGCAGLIALALFLRTQAELAVAPRILRASVWELCRTGLPFAATRIVTLGFSWCVAWAVAIHRGPASAGVVGTLMQLATAIGAPLAAFRFVMRPKLVELWVLQDKANLQKLNLWVSLNAAAGAVAAILVANIIGQPLLDFFFGENFQAALPILLLAMVGLVGECLTGIADEVVRVANRANRVLMLQIGLMSSIAPLIYVLAKIGPLAAIGAYVVYSFSFATVMLFWSIRLLSTSPYQQHRVIVLKASE
jgi:O-antigen/teichoic acid export membrane protein